MVAAAVAVVVAVVGTSVAVSCHGRERWGWSVECGRRGK